MFWFGALIYLIACGYTGYKVGSKKESTFKSLIAALGILAFAWLAYCFGYFILAVALF